MTEHAPLRTELPFSNAFDINSFGTPSRLAALYISSAEQLFSLQAKLGEEMFSANLKYLSLPTDRANTETLIAQWPETLLETGRQFTHAVQGCAEIVAQSQIELARLLIGAMSSATATGASTAMRPAHVPERRVASVVINFPDRRAAIRAAEDRAKEAAGSNGKPGTKRRTTP